MVSSDGSVDMSAFGLNLPLPPYYMPIFNSVQDLFRMGDDRNLEYPGGLAVPAGVADEEDHGDGDYIDHLQQPGNTKKRKVPAAHHSTADPLSSPTMMGDDDQDERAGSMATPSRTDGVDLCDVAPTALAASPPALLSKKNRSSAATLAGLQHKELLKTRKRQLASVLGALSHGDTLALDQALSARYSNMVLPSGQNKGEGKENEPDPIFRRRWLKRRVTGWELLPPPNPSSDIAVPSAEFTFACPSLSELPHFLVVGAGRSLLPQLLNVLFRREKKWQFCIRVSRLSFLARPLKQRKSRNRMLSQLKAGRSLGGRIAHNSDRERREL